MSNSLGRLVVQLGLDAAEYTRGLSKSEYQVQQWVRKVESGVEFARSSFLAFGAAAAGAVALVNAQANKIAGFQDLADQIGDSAEAVASLNAASQISGTSLEQVAQASVKLTSALAKSDDEAKGVGLALGAIGLELEEFKRLSPVAQIDAVAQAFAGFEDGAGKTAVAVELFGRSGAQIIPLLNDLADGAERQIFLTQEQIAAADAYSKQVARLTGDLQNLATTAAADAVPQLSAMATILQDLVQYSKDAGDGFGLLDTILSGARVTLETLVIVGSDVVFVFRGFAREFEAIAAQIGAIFSGPVEGAWQRGQEARQRYIEDAIRARQELDAFQRRILNPIQFGADDQSAAEARRLGLSGPSRTLNFNGAPPTKPKGSGAGSFLDYGQQITQRVGNLLESSDVTQAKIYADTLAKLDELFFSGAINADLYDSAMKKLTGSTDSAAREASKFVEEQKRLAELLGATESAGIARQNADIEILQKALAAGIINVDKYAEAVRAMVGGVAEKTKEAKTFAEEFGLAFTSAFEDAIVEGGKFSDVLKGLGQDILRIIVRKQVTEPLGNFFSGLDFGGFFGSLFGGPRANGGPVSGGTSYLVGERGPELFTPSISGRITPNNALGGAVTVNVINQGNTGLQVTGQRQRAGADGGLTIDVIVQAVEAGIADNVANRSGALSRALEGGYGLRPAMS